MQQSYIDENIQVINQIIAEMTDGFNKNKRVFMPKELTTGKDDVVVTRQRKERAPRYGVKLQQDGENYVYKYIRVIKQVLVQTYDIDKDLAETEATDIMGTYVLPKVLDNCKIEYVNRYDENIAHYKRFTNIKVFGICLTIVLLLVVLFASIFAK